MAPVMNPRIRMPSTSDERRDRYGSSCLGTRFEPGQVRVDHHLNEAPKIDHGLPAQDRASPACVTQKVVNFGGAMKLRVVHEVPLVVQAEAFKGDLTELSHRVRYSSCDDEIGGLALLKHLPHRSDVVTGEAPIPLGVQVAHPQFARQPKLDPGGAIGHLAAHELTATARRLMVEQDSGSRVHAEALAVVHRQEMTIGLGDPVWATRVEWRELCLRRLANLAKHLARRGLIETYRQIRQADGLQDSGHTEAGELARQDGLVPRSRHKALSCQVVDLVGLDRLDRGGQRRLVKEVALDQLKTLPEMLDSLIGVGAGPPGHPNDAVALLKQKLREVGAVLAGDPGNERSLHLAEYSVGFRSRRDTRALRVSALRS